MKRSIISRSSRFPFCWFGFNILSSKTSCFPNGRRKEEKDEDTESNGINRTWGGGIIKKKGGKLGGAGLSLFFISYDIYIIYVCIHTNTPRCLRLSVSLRYVHLYTNTHTHTHTRRERCTYVCVFCGGRVRVSLQRKFDTRAHLFIGCLLKNVATYLPKLVVSFFSSSPSPVFLFLANSPRERYTHFL